MKFLTLLLVILAISLTFVSAFEDTYVSEFPALEDMNLLDQDGDVAEFEHETTLSKDEHAALDRHEAEEEKVAQEETNTLDAAPVAVEQAQLLPEAAAAPEVATTVPSVIKVLLIIFGSIGGFFMFMLPMGVIVTFASTMFVAYQKKKIAEHQEKQNSIKSTIENVSVDYTSLDKKVIPGGAN